MIRLGTAPSVAWTSQIRTSIRTSYAFSADRSMRHLAAAAPVGPEEQQAILSAPPTTTWTVDDKGRLLTRERRDGAGGRRPSDLANEDQRPEKPGPRLPGDLLLTHYSEDGKPVARRLLRKMSTERVTSRRGGRSSDRRAARGPEELEDTQDQERTGAQRREQDQNLFPHPRLHIFDLSGARPTTKKIRAQYRIRTR
jgi:hypothetical protein